VLTQKQKDFQGITLELLASTVMWQSATLQTRAVASAQMPRQTNQKPKTAPSTQRLQLHGNAKIQIN
jgi:hypothetical protein